ncbi:ABC transporter permease [Nonomuraea mesophila]|uniref:ABC transporter permease n=1 Tax=Nonomuraea mesophila TaxID=2530382 RepID=A0A4R5FSW6_9ACTN|nr:ABC transporter permease [Nonomuraea mesophila]TDE56526.1 ABC transporter permease [Nonomuraea mesophila]
MSLPRYAVRRLPLAGAQVAAVTTLIFLLVELLPGDAAVILAGDAPDPARVEQIRAELGLDRPLPERFAEWAAGLARLDLGSSIVSGLPVSQIVLGALEPTLLLAGLTLALLMPLAVVAGVSAAIREGGLLDRALTSTGVALYSVPEFALAMVLIAVFSAYLGWLPATAIDGLGPAVLVLPLLVLLARPLSSTGRLVRAGMIDALRAGYTRHALRLGVSTRRARYAHALPNALAPAVQQLARTVDWLLGGVIVVEAAFVIPGLGTVLVDAVADRDLPVIQGLAVLFATTTVLVNLAADLVAFRLVPRA